MAQRSPTNGPLVLAVDSSTTATKTLVVDATGGVLAQGRATYPMATPAKDLYEQDATHWLAAAHRAIGEVVAALTPGERNRISGMCVTPQRQTFVLCDEAGRPSRPAILWLDGRAGEQVARLGSEWVHATSGMVPDVTPSLYKLAWLSEHEPHTLSSAARVVGVHAYLAHAFTGEWVDSRATADSLGLFDMAALTWSDGLLEMAGVRRDQLPELGDTATVLGEVRTEVAQGWGLPGPIPLVAGCGDGQAAGIGAGVTRPDEGYLNLGTAVVAGVHVPQYRWGRSYRTDAAGLPGHFVLEVVQNSGAYLTDWFRAQLGDAALLGAPDQELERAASDVPAGSDGLLTLPYWNAVQSPHWDPRARGAMVGFSGAQTRAAMYRSVLEGISMETGRNLRALVEDTGTPLTTLRIMGGGQRSALWRRIMAACVGVPLETCASEEVSALGAAAMAMAVVTDTDVATCAQAMAAPGEITEPDPDLVERYDEIGALQGELYDRLADLFPRLH
ncbi:xylulokinase [Tessaracoccus antarcticus]|uniref:Xylulose kinase n=1 Tax=Tessaracoccus antarcticus TaxID=2479848 RepID=A0A3M0G0G7_9ACTN|nr:FGGY family carbohydrate kinase [Tessaracoccus antarcticus]RMB58245.1 xylulose kinase [Tessaracoccus antarcticus]